MKDSINFLGEKIDRDCRIEIVNEHDALRARWEEETQASMKRKEDEKIVNLAPSDAQKSIARMKQEIINTRWDVARLSMVMDLRVFSPEIFPEYKPKFDEEKSIFNHYEMALATLQDFEDNILTRIETWVSINHHLQEMRELARKIRAKVYEHS